MRLKQCSKNPGKIVLESLDVLHFCYQISMTTLMRIILILSVDLMKQTSKLIYRYLSPR